MEDIKRLLTETIDREIKLNKVPSLSAALVVDQDIVWSHNFPEKVYKDQSELNPAYRVASVSKIFNAIAIMQLVEKGVLDLDEPVSKYLPSFQPHNAFNKPILLRHLLMHRSGLVREPPIGGSFDDKAVSLKETVGSMNQTSLVEEPGIAQKYSNAAVSVSGYILEHMFGRPYPEYMREHILEPLGMKSSSFAKTGNLNIPKAKMWASDGPTYFKAPDIEVTGIAPGGGLYATVDDIAQLLKMMFAGGKTEKGRIIEEKTLLSMYEGISNGVNAQGIGFAIESFGSFKMVKHGGELFGFSTQFAALPDAKVGVIMTCSLGNANGMIDKIAAYALELLLIHKNLVDKPIPPIPVHLPFRESKMNAKELAGVYRSAEGSELKLHEANGQLYLFVVSVYLECKYCGEDDEGKVFIPDDRLATKQNSFTVHDIDSDSKYLRKSRACCRRFNRRLRLTSRSLVSSAFTELIGKLRLFWSTKGLFGC
eukprot:TRINITY_DN6308_c0_g1_i2.p1 TRINITY_DN6308_c0_g1~~TRINITY_DN6308_c0_g1_i2.p1  ORF type:complete len:498 (+),score=95.19 TRINITY_DN6308_c0_g1_i2:53-1495(+)